VTSVGDIEKDGSVGWLLIRALLCFRWKGRKCGLLLDAAMMCDHVGPCDGKSPLKEVSVGILLDVVIDVCVHVGEVGKEVGRAGLICALMCVHVGAGGKGWQCGFFARVATLSRHQGARFGHSFLRLT
jgi:hypothetical protein